MVIYLFNIIVIIICCNTCIRVKNDKKVIENKKLSCFIFSFLWILISGLRGLSVGEDTFAYKNDFIAYSNTPWTVLINNVLLKISNVDNMLEGYQINKDPGFRLLTKIMSIVAPTFQLYLILVAVIFMSLLGRFLYKNTEKPFLGFILFDCLFYSFYAITGIRQTLATALIVLVGYDYIKERKILKFLILSLIAFLIHKSSICFMPFYFLCKIKINKISIGLFSLLIVLSFIYRYQMMNFLSTFMGYEQYNRQYDNGNGPVTFTMLVLAVFIFCCVFMKKMKENDGEFELKFIALSMSLFFMPLAFIDPSAMRVAYYYALFLMILMPDVVRIFDERQQRLITSAITCAMVLLLISNNPVYKFYWMEG